MDSGDLANSDQMADEEGIEAVVDGSFVQDNIEELVAIQTAALAEVAKQEQQERDRSRSRSPVEKRSRRRSRSKDRGDRGGRGGRDRGSDRRRDRGRDGGGRRRPTYSSIPGAKRNKIINYDCCVFISNIDYKVTWQELKDVLKRHVGEVGYVELFAHPDSTSKGCAFVEFKNRDDAKKAVSEMDRFEIHSRKLVVKEDSEGRHSEKYFRQREADDKAKNVLTPQLLQQLNLDPANLCDTVFVANLSYEVTWRKLKDVFKLAGPVARSEIMEEKGKSRGMGTVQFETILAAVNAICMFDGQMLYDRRMAVRMDKEKVRSSGGGKEVAPRPQPLPSGLASVGPSIESLAGGGGGGSGGGADGGNFGSGIAQGLGNIGGLGGGNVGLSGLNLGSLGGIGGGLGGGSGLPSGLGQNLGQSLGSGLGGNLGSSLGGNLGGSLGNNLSSGLGGLGGPGLGGGLGSSGLGGLSALSGLGGSGGLGLGSDVGRGGSSNLGSFSSFDLGSGGMGGNQGLGLGSLNDLDRELLGNSGGYGNDRDFMDDRDRDRGGRDRDRYRDRDRDRGGRDRDRDRGDRGRRGGGGGGRGGGGDKGMPKEDGKQVFVRNLPFSYTWQKLKDIFKDCGKVMFASVKTDDMGRSRGFGTVRFESSSAAQMAINMMSGSDVEGRMIEVTLDCY